jgi:hypothetical protein
MFMHHLYNIHTDEFPYVPGLCGIHSSNLYTHEKHTKSRYRIIIPYTLKNVCKS